MPSRPKLAAAATQKIKDLLRAGLNIIKVRKALYNKVLLN